MSLASALVMVFATWFLALFLARYVSGFAWLVPLLLLGCSGSIVALLLEVQK